MSGKGRIYYGAGITVQLDVQGMMLVIAVDLTKCKSDEIEGHVEWFLYGHQMCCQ